MTITDNLINDISDAPSWFLESIEIKAVDLYVDDKKGKISYSRWDAENNSNNLLILIHGTGAHKKWWDPIAPLISENYSIIAPDLPGMGESDHRKEYNFKEFSEALIAILHQENVANAQKIYLIGHSLGGHVAGYMASEFPDLFDGIVMIDSPIRPPTYDYDKHKSTGPLRKIKLYPDKMSIIERFRLMPPQDCENDWYLRYIAEHSILNIDKGWRWRFDDKMFATLQRLHNYEFKFQCPALFIAGGKSLLLESKIMKYIREAFKESMTVEVIEDAAHHVPLDSPLELVNLLNNYLDKWENKI